MSSCLEAIGHTPGAAALLRKAGIDPGGDRALVSIAGNGDAKKLIDVARAGRAWEREPIGNGRRAIEQVRAGSPGRR